MDKGVIVGIGWLVLIVFFFGSGINAAIFEFPAEIYDINKAQGYLKQARSSTDLTHMAGYATQAYNEIEDRTGNPAWWYPTEKTSFDTIKAVLQENIEASLTIAATEPIGSYGYQRAIDNMEESILDINTHLDECSGLLTTTSLKTTIIMLLELVYLIILIIATTVIIDG